MTADNASFIINILLDAKEKIMRGAIDDGCDLLNNVHAEVFDAAYFDSGTNLGKEEWGKENRVQLPIRYPQRQSE